MCCVIQRVTFTNYTLCEYLIYKELIECKFGICSKLYAEAVRLCLSLGEKDAAMNIISDMEEMGVAAPEDLLTDVLRETQSRQISDVLGVEPS